MTSRGKMTYEGVPSPVRDMAPERDAEHQRAAAEASQNKAMLYSAVTTAISRLAHADRVKQYRNDPVLWARERAGIYLWSKQAEIAMDVARQHDVLVKASFGVGKSYLASVLVVWWLDTRLPGDTFAATTAPSTAQISAIVWRNIRQIVARIGELHPDEPVPGHITSLNIWRLEDGRDIAYGRKPADQNAADTFQGIHAAEGVIAVGDEAVSLPKDLIVGLQKITSDGQSRRFLICNPTDPSSYIAELFEKRPANWTFHTISALESPHFTGEIHPGTGDTDGWMGLVDQSFVDSIVLEYGEDSPQYKVMVLGEFAELDKNPLFTQDVLTHGWDLEIPETGERPILGCDVARFGADSSVVYLNDGGRIRLKDTWSKTDGTETANRIHRLAIDTGAQEVRIDGTGLGGPIVDMVLQLCEGKYRVRSIIGAAASPDKRRWYNFRAYIYDSVRHAMRFDQIDVDFEDLNLRQELGKTEYTFRLGGLLLESKEDMKKRGIKSPDYADAFIYAAAPDETLDYALVGAAGYIEEEALREANEPKLWDSL